MKMFKKKYSRQLESDKPLLLILWPQMFMSQFIGEMSQTLRQYNDMFEIYYCKDEKLAKQMFNTSMMPRELPHVYIVDPGSEPVPIKKTDGTDTGETYVKKH